MPAPKKRKAPTQRGPPPESKKRGTKASTASTANEEPVAETTPAVDPAPPATAVAEESKDSTAVLAEAAAAAAVEVEAQAAAAAQAEAAAETTAAASTAPEKSSETAAASSTADAPATDAAPATTTTAAPAAATPAPAATPKSPSKSKSRKSSVPEVQLNPEEATAHWNAMLFELLLFKSDTGDFNVRATDEEHKPLHFWMQQQRKQYKLYQNKLDGCMLTEKQVKVLDSLHFSWNTRGEEHWKRNYERLKQFHKENGHTLVPRQSPVPKLGDWVTEQRRQYKAMKEGKDTLLTKERIAQLEGIGFVWQVRQRTGWQDRFDQLAEFKSKNNGSTVVPQHYTENRALGKWVAKQREQYRLLCMGKHSFLTPDRVQQLKSIDFVWSVKGRAPDTAAAAANGTTATKTEDTPATPAETPADAEAAPATADSGEAAEKPTEGEEAAAPAATATDTAKENDKEGATDAPAATEGTTPAGSEELKKEEETETSAAVEAAVEAAADTTVSV
mmetsp:Transcript_25637/g.36151  ORF Transcript_25637/g.36151 Transcript_25637/m.36151 type:complete len:504 (-) Transcript_25637:221-1732(-)